MQKSLQRAFIDEVGESTDLRNVLSLMDPYMKKLLLMSGTKTWKQISRERHNLKLLLQDTGASTTFCTIKHTIKGNNIEQYNHDSSGAYILCVALLGRNEWHDSPEWDAEDVYRMLRYAMAAYVLATCHLARQVKTYYPNIGKKVRIDLSEINETGYVYDFINYGDTSYKIKNRIVESFILHFVYSKGGTAATDEVVREVKTFSRQSLTDNGIRTMIGRMVPEKMDYDTALKRNVLLNTKEKERLTSALKSYELLVERLVAEIANLLEGYGLKERTQEVYDRLKQFFENNCLSILKLLGEQDGELSMERTDEYIGDFRQFLRDIGCPDEKREALFSGLLRICQLNDVLVKIAPGKNFTDISNPDAFASGQGQRDKKVYLDTQLLLYALCVNTSMSVYAESPSCLIVKSLLSAARQNPHIHLATIDEYVEEVAYHLKRAAQLVPFDDVVHEQRIRLSNNVFYGYYYYLKDNGLLNEGMETLGDFLYELFEVDYDDLHQSDFEGKYYGYILDLLETDYGIEVEKKPYFPENEVNNSVRAFTTALAMRQEDRNEIAARRDAFMGLHLFGGGRMGEPEPFFLSWDRTFYQYRRDYMKNYMKASGAQWHLFSPAKFVNHLNLLEMRIDVDVMTEDLISIIEDDDTAKHTKRVLDSVGKLLEKSNVTSRQKRQEYSRIIFNETEFPNDTEQPEESRLRLTNNVAAGLDKLLSMMQVGKHRFGEFAAIIADASRFKGLVSAMRQGLQIESVEECSNRIYEELVREIEAGKE